MLLYFKIKNNRSFDKETTFSLISHNRKNKKGNFFQIEKYELSVLKSMAIYGANASGKSNLLKAMVDGVQIIKKGILSDKDKNGLNDAIASRYFPNKNKVENLHLPSDYVYGLFIDEVYYEFSFSHNDKRIVQEKLVKYLPNDKFPKVIYLRSFVKGDYVWYFENNIADSEIIQATKISTNRYTLWLTEVSKILKEKQTATLLYIEHIFNWFDNDIIHSINLVSPGRIEIAPALLAMHYDKKIKSQFLKLLKKADFNIEDIYIQLKKIDDEKVNIEAYTVRKGVDLVGNIHQNRYDIFSEDSTGTQQFIAWLFVWYNAINQDKLIVIDEFGNSMHPILSDFLLSLFKRNTKTQVIFSTHYTELMDRRKFNDEQICLINKDKEGNSMLSFLSDYDIPPNVLLDKVYLQGLFGSVPDIDFAINFKK